MSEKQKKLAIYFFFRMKVFRKVMCFLALCEINYSILREPSSPEKDFQRIVHMKEAFLFICVLCRQEKITNNSSVLEKSLIKALLI